MSVNYLDLSIGDNTPEVVTAVAEIPLDSAQASLFRACCDYGVRSRSRARRLFTSGAEDRRHNCQERLPAVEIASSVSVPRGRSVGMGLG